jgi:hypothetical protein
MRRIAASLAVSVTLWELEGTATTRRGFAMLACGHGILPCESVRYSHFRRKSTDLSALQGV